MVWSYFLGVQRCTSAFATVRVKGRSKHSSKCGRRGNNCNRTPSRIHTLSKQPILGEHRREPFKVENTFASLRFKDVDREPLRQNFASEDAEGCQSKPWTWPFWKGHLGRLRRRGERVPPTEQRSNQRKTILWSKTIQEMKKLEFCFFVLAAEFFSKRTCQVRVESEAEPTSYGPWHLRVPNRTAIAGDLLNWEKQRGGAKGWRCRSLARKNTGCNTVSERFWETLVPSKPCCKKINTFFPRLAQPRYCSASWKMYVSRECREIAFDSLDLNLNKKWCREMPLCCDNLLFWWCSGVSQKHWKTKKTLKRVLSHLKPRKGLKRPR